MADRDRTVSRRCARYLLGMIESDGSHRRPEAYPEGESRDDVLGWLAQFDDRMLLDTLHHLYRMAGQNAAKEQKSTRLRLVRSGRRGHRFHD